MAVTTFIILVVYILGVYTAYYQIQRWADYEVSGEDEYRTLFLLSLFSWLIYPIFGLIWLIRKVKELEE